MKHWQDIVKILMFQLIRDNTVTVEDDGRGKLQYITERAGSMKLQFTNGNTVKPRKK